MRLEFLLIRYVPDAVRGEFVNFGILLRQRGEVETTKVCITGDWSRVKGLDAGADIELLASLGHELADRSRSAHRNLPSINEFLAQELSGAVQVTELQISEAASFEEKMASLMYMYVEQRDQRTSLNGKKESDLVPPVWNIYPSRLA